jgi:hypothetical protein
VWANGLILFASHREGRAHKRKGIPPIFSDWSRVIETFGDMMEQTDDYPRRYRVREFPVEKVIDGMGSTELGLG